VLYLYVRLSSPKTRNFQWLCQPLMVGAVWKGDPKAAVLTFVQSLNDIRIKLIWWHRSNQSYICRPTKWVGAVVVCCRCHHRLTRMCVVPAVTRMRQTGVFCLCQGFAAIIPIGLYTLNRQLTMVTTTGVGLHIVSCKIHSRRISFAALVFLHSSSTTSNHELSCRENNVVVR
jgi:hypothetical protein